jgi:hypothetical protein
MEAVQIQTAGKTAEEETNMTFEQAKQEVVKCSGKGIRRPCWKDKTLRITGDKQFAGARTVPKGKESTVINDMTKDIQRKRETIYDGSDLFYQTDITSGYSDGGIYNGKPLKVGFAGEGLPYGREDYLSNDWEIYMSEDLKNV